MLKHFLSKAWAVPHKDMYKDVHGSIVHTIPKLKTTRKQLKYPPTGECIFKNMAYPHSELLLNNKKKKLLIHASP